MSYQCYLYVGVALVLVLVNSKLSSAATEDAESKLLREYDRRICKNEPSCDLTNSVRKDRLTLKKRNCMCDFECSEHGDCCMDSQYFNAVSSDRKYSCHPYSEVYVIVNCASDYQNRTVIANCEKALRPLEENNFDLVIPVTNVDKRRTYANKYCALCNHDREYKPWDFYAGCGEPVDEEIPFVSPAQGARTKPTSTFSTPVPKSQSTRIPRPRPKQDNSKKYETNTKMNVISDDFVGGCKTENSPCRDGYKPPVTPAAARVPYYPKNDHWVGDMLNIRIEIGGRFKRQQSTNVGSKRINYKKYEAKIDDLIERARYDARSKNFVVTSDEGKYLVCRFNSTYPKTMEDAVRTCVPNIVSECSSTGGSPCPSYVSIVYDTKSRTRYRNSECARCNGIQDDKRLTGCPPDQRSIAGSKDIAKTKTGSQGTDLQKFSDPAISFN